MWSSSQLQPSSYAKLEEKSTKRQQCRPVCCVAGSAVKAAGVAVLFAVFANEIFSVALAPRYVVHSSGVVVVTGASSGIGEEAARTLVSTTGYTVFAGVRKQADAQRLESKNPGLRTVFLDVTSADSIAAAVRFVRNATALPLVGLVNNAGVQKDLPIELQSSEADRFTFSVNVFGMLDVTRAFLPALRETGNGARIVNMGSLSGVIASAGSASYCASKFAVEGLTDALRREVASFGISVSLLEPGYVKSEMGTKQYGDEAAFRGVSAQERELYRQVFDGFFADDRWNSLPENSSPAETTTSAAILDALQSPKPRTRYAVASAAGLPASVIVWLVWLLPDRMADLILA